MHFPFLISTLISIQNTDQVKNLALFFFFKDCKSLLALCLVGKWCTFAGLLVLTVF